MRIPGDPVEPWLAGLPPDASEAAKALAKWMWDNGSRPGPGGAWQSGTPAYHDAGYTTPAQAQAAPPPPPIVYDPTSVAPPPVAATAPDPTKDPEYIDLLAALTRNRHDAIVNYGDAAGTNADADTAAQASANPYSITHQLAQQLSQNVSGVNNAANAHGGLYSGANVQGQQNQYAAGQQASYNARKALLDQLNAYADQQKQGYYDTYRRLAGGIAG
jgi:hypothetical protein